MDLWNDNKIIDIINELKSKRRINRLIASKETPKFVFVCGKQILDANGKMLSKGDLENNIRFLTIELLENRKISNMYGSKSKLVKCVVSEKLYTQDLAEDIFSFEEMLAEISEKIIIVAESPGTFCELGAFVMNDDFMKKTIVLNEDNPDYAGSFITLGPIKKIQSYSEWNVILHNGIDRIKLSTEFNQKMKDISNTGAEIIPNKNPNRLKLRSLIYEFANIVELFQPLEAYEIEQLYKNICNFNKYSIENVEKHKINSFRKVVNLMEKMDILIKKKGMYSLNSDITCYNAMFIIDRKEFNVLRMNIISRIYKKQPERMCV